VSLKRLDSAERRAVELQHAVAKLDAKTMLKYCGEVYEGKPQGHGIAEYGPLGAGCSYDGGWLNGERHGFATTIQMSMDDSTVSEGFWMYDEMHDGALPSTADSASPC